MHPRTSMKRVAHSLVCQLIVRLMVNPFKTRLSKLDKIITDGPTDREIWTHELIRVALTRTKSKYTPTCADATVGARDLENIFCLRMQGMMRERRREKEIEKSAEASKLVIHYFFSFFFHSFYRVLFLFEPKWPCDQWGKIALYKTAEES